MPSEVTLKPPQRLMPYWDQIDEGWRAFFDEQNLTDNPHEEPNKYEAWKWGYMEAMDYGS